MITQTAAPSETNNRMGHALETASKIAAAGVDLGLLKKKLEHAVEDAVLEAERMAKHGRHAVEDVMEDTTYWIKKNPWQSVACGRRWIGCRAVCRLVRLTNEKSLRTECPIPVAIVTSFFLARPVRGEVCAQRPSPKICFLHIRACHTTAKTSA